MIKSIIWILEKGYKNDKRQVTHKNTIIYTCKYLLICTHAHMHICADNIHIYIFAYLAGKWHTTATTPETKFKL